MKNVLVAAILLVVCHLAYAATYQCDQVIVSAGAGAAYTRVASVEINMSQTAVSVNIAGVTYTLNRAAIELSGQPVAYVLGNITLAQYGFFGAAQRIEVSIGDVIGPSQDPSNAGPAKHYLCWP